MEITRVWYLRTSCWRITNWWASEIQKQIRAYVFFDFNSLNSPFLGFWVVQTGYWPVPFPTHGWNLCRSLDYNIKVNFHIVVAIMKQGQSSVSLESFLLEKIFVMKNVSDFRKFVETGVDPRLT